MASSNMVAKLYGSVIDDVINNVRDVFLDDGIDEQILLDLKSVWERKLVDSKAIEPRESADGSSGNGSQTQRSNHSSNNSRSTNRSNQSKQQQQDQRSAQAGVIVPQRVAGLYTAPGGAVMSSPAAAATLALPPEVLQQFHQNQPTVAGSVIRAAGPSSQQAPDRIVQLDGPIDSSDDDEEEDEYRDHDDEHEDNEEDGNEEGDDGTGEEEEPLNSEDDVSDEEPAELFDTDNVVVCQYDKITRSRNKWKFHLKDGIMNLQGKDFVFQKAIGDAEW